MQRDILLLSEMVDAAEQAQRLVAGFSAAEVGADRMRRDSLVWNFTVLGEAATLVSSETKAARASDHDSPLLEPTLTGIVEMIGPLPQHPRRAWRGPVPDAAPGPRLRLGQDPRPAEDPGLSLSDRGHSWMNGYGTLRRLNDRRRIIVEFYLNLAAALTVLRCLINRACTTTGGPTRPTARRLR
jgi:hypothetical protein